MDGNQRQPKELAQIARVKSQAINARKENQANELDAAEIVALVRDHLAERRATFAEHDLIAEALNRGMGKVSLRGRLKVEYDMQRLPHCFTKWRGASLATSWCTSASIHAGRSLVAA